MTTALPPGSAVSPPAPARDSVRAAADALAFTRRAWIIVEHRGDVVTHAAGPRACPEWVAAAVLRRDPAMLRRHCQRQSSASSDSQQHWRAVRHADVTIWTDAGELRASDLEELLAALVDGQRPLTDAVVHDLLHPRGPARMGGAPRCCLVAVLCAQPAALSHLVVPLLPTGCRVHVEDDVVLLALASSEQAPVVVDRLRRHDSSVHAGLAIVPEHASDWVRSARLATALAQAARQLGRPLATTQDWAVLAGLIVSEAREAARNLVCEIGLDPLQDLRTYDTRTGGDLERTLGTWLASGSDMGLVARQLHVHVNTARYRIRRVADLTGADLEDSNQRLALSLVL